MSAHLWSQLLQNVSQLPKHFWAFGLSLGRLGRRFDRRLDRCRHLDVRYRFPESSYYKLGKQESNKKPVQKHPTMSSELFRRLC